MVGNLTELLTGWMGRGTSDPFWYRGADIYKHWGRVIMTWKFVSPDRNATLSECEMKFRLDELAHKGEAWRCEVR